MDTTLTPEQAFALLGSETRFAVLKTLWDAPDHTLPFAELRSAVGVRDPGQFNYHLKQLVGSFVAKTERGYRLRIAGERVVGAVLSGAYTWNETIGPVDTDGQCPECSGSLGVSYREEQARLDCLSCGEVYSTFPVPVGALEPFAPEKIPRVFDQWLKVGLRQITAEICPLCTGQLVGALGSECDPDSGLLGGTYTCQRCGEQFDSVLGGFLLEHPAVVAFYFECGVDVRETPIWAFEWLFDETCEELIDDDPPMASVTITEGEEQLRLTVNDELHVVDTDRSE